MICFLGGVILILFFTSGMLGIKLWNQSMLVDFQEHMLEKLYKKNLELAKDLSGKD